MECGINFRDNWSIFTCSGDKRRAFTVQLMALHILCCLHVPQRCVHKGCSFDWSYPCKFHKYPLDIDFVSNLLPLFASIGNCYDKNCPEQNPGIEISNRAIQLISLSHNLVQFSLTQADMGMRIIYSLTFIQKFFKVSLNFASAWCLFWNCYSGTLNNCMLLC